jgi:hypothetical protein
MFELPHASGGRYKHSSSDIAFPDASVLSLDILLLSSHFIRVYRLQKTRFRVSPPVLP